MVERVRHDAPSVRTIDATVSRRGRTGRSAVAIPADPGMEPGTAVRLVLDDREYWTVPERPLDGSDLEIRSLYETAEGAREGKSPSGRLQEWLEAADLEPGRTVHLDVVADGYRYGFRAPGETAIYDAGQPDSGLRDIAEDL